MITGYDHVQVAIPPAGEHTARAFYAGVAPLDRELDRELDLVATRRA